MTQFRYPVTLTFVQFGFVGLYCLLFMSPVIRFSRLRKPTISILKNALPMGMFQVGGHMCSSMAISRIPVSTVHTIKVCSSVISIPRSCSTLLYCSPQALSPLFTVMAYAILFGVNYSSRTYLSLLPLTIGVMLACSFDTSASNVIGLLCAFGSALVFVSSNIFFKRIIPSDTSTATHPNSHKLDKLNLLLYSSGMAFLLMIPIWIYCDLFTFLEAQLNRSHLLHPDPGHSIPHSVTYYLFMNGTVHFAQNIIAFILLSSTSPVTYSIASLTKRVAVICIAIIWFNQNVHLIQAFGIALTFFGLYMYNEAKGDVSNGEKRMQRAEAARDMILPRTHADIRMLNGVPPPPAKSGRPLVETPGLVSMAAYDGQRGTTSAAHVSQSADCESRSNSRSLFKPHPTSLTIRITLPTNLKVTTQKAGSVASSIDSYPSPPHSPPSSATLRLESVHLPSRPIQDKLVLPHSTTVAA